MPQVNMKDDQKPVIPAEEPIMEQPATTIPTPEDTKPYEDENLPPSDKIAGLVGEELTDPNKISVTIADQTAPIVVLFGPPACGKTMTLIRLARFLRDNGYEVKPEGTFRRTDDANYADICENFDVMLNQDDAAKSTSKISFMLVKVQKDAKTICQILEAPGEYYFDPNFPKSPFPRYFNAIKSSKNRKIWTIMVEPDWQNESDRLNYVDRIKKLKTQMAVRDSAIIVYNKIDKTEFLIDNSGHAHMKLARKNICDLYPNIFEPFKNTIPLIRWLVPYNFEFAIFQTGDYSKASDGTSLFEQGPDVFPHRLWSIILNKVRG